MRTPDIHSPSALSSPSSPSIPSPSSTPHFGHEDNEYDQWGEAPPAISSPHRTSLVQEDLSRASLESIRPSGLTDNGTEQRVVDVVRIPNSQLRFFPKRNVSISESRRTSLEQDMRRVSLERGLRRSVSLRYTPPGDGPSIQNDLHTLPAPLQTEKERQNGQKSNMVKIRPQGSIRTSPSTGSLTDRLTSFFSIPPPPPGIDRSYSPLLDPTAKPPKSAPASTPATSFSSKSRRSSSLSPAVLLEMRPRSNGKSVQPNKKTD